jgi:hypothetical protein
MWVILGTLVALSIAYYNSKRSYEVPQNPAPLIKGPMTPPPSNASVR